jgi:hypothetical protein
VAEDAGAWKAPPPCVVTNEKDPRWLAGLGGIEIEN